MGQSVDEAWVEATAKEVAQEEIGAWSAINKVLDRLERLEEALQDEQERESGVAPGQEPVGQSLRDERAVAQIEREKTTQVPTPQLTGEVRRVLDLLERAKKAATLENASFGFPNDRLQVKAVHFGDDRTGRVGDVLHPDDYIRRITRNHHRAWIIGPIEQAIDLLTEAAHLTPEAESEPDAPAPSEDEEGEVEPELPSYAEAVSTLRSRLRGTATLSTDSAYNHLRSLAVGEIQRLQGRLTLATEGLAAFQSQAGKSIRRLERIIARLQRELESTQRQLQHRDADRQDLIELLGLQGRQSPNVYRAVQRLQRELSGWKNRATHAEAARSEDRSTIRRLMAENERLRRELIGAERKIARLLDPGNWVVEREERGNAHVRYVGPSDDHESPPETEGEEGEVEPDFWYSLTNDTASDRKYAGARLKGYSHETVQRLLGERDEARRVATGLDKDVDGYRTLVTKHLTRIRELKAEIARLQRLNDSQAVIIESLLDAREQQYNKIARLRDLVRRARPPGSLSSHVDAVIQKAREWIEERDAILTDKPRPPESEGEDGADTP